VLCRHLTHAHILQAKFAKGKTPLLLRFVPAMSGVFFTPGINGRAEGDRRVAHAVYIKKEKVFEIHGYKPQYAGQQWSDRKDERCVPLAPKHYPTL
jgi:hypothetical protein